MSVPDEMLTRVLRAIYSSGRNRSLVKVRKRVRILSALVNGRSAEDHRKIQALRIRAQDYFL
jgi:hypothetical protein